MADLPRASSAALTLVHPTLAEKKHTWTLNSQSWGTALAVDDYLERESYLASIPATRDGGVTHWILTDSTAPAESRPVLACCESLRRRAVISLPGSPTKEVITHGIGSVFCPPAYRGRGYASRMLALLAPILKTWQKEEGECYFSILYSDIGKKYYAGLGWDVFPSAHISLPALAAPVTNGVTTNGTNGVTVNGTNGVHKTKAGARTLTPAEIAPLCALDEQYIGTAVQSTAKHMNKPAVALLADYSTMEWHHLREDFMCDKLFQGKVPTIKGAISSGDKGSRIWTIFTRSFYGPLQDPKSGNVLHLLRLVMEDEQDTEENAQKLKSVLEVAQREAGTWGLAAVEMWNVSPVGKALLERTGLEHKAEEREEESICSLMWYGPGKGGVEGVEWVANEKFGWC
ncbi:Uncharacterized protein BP5553_10277 [Venustampulla echinocandica]|uniref:LYC1 C-terminal domain-containing protein n=1 Tax=Venustampulla echinocandica TaxID=2656787 RepID=A0A370T9R4_9HELO|nr:Uncharacterized protein BP5553_10277 [Venustampulla echinocandica]RDL30399.1 Uncharacterized protein BP5553_10277 [Venustampulla echinocandica]